MTVSTSTSAALELTYRGRDEVIAYACPRCGVLFSPTIFGGEDPEAHEIAQRFAIEHCDKHCRCGVSIPSSRILCEKCWRSDQITRDLKKFERAEKVEEDAYGDPVFWEGNIGSMGDGYFASLDEVYEHCEDEGIDRPIYVWACNPVPLQIAVDDILESAFQEHFEAARDTLSSAAEMELTDFLLTWCARQNIQSWQPDFRKAILLDQITVEGEDPEYGSPA